MSTIPTNRSIKIKQVAQLTIPNAQGPPQHFWPPRQQHASQKIAAHGIPYLKRQRIQHDLARIRRSSAVSAQPSR